jgi:hypothetical protein
MTRLIINNTAATGHDGVSTANNAIVIRLAIDISVSHCHCGTARKCIKGRDNYRAERVSNPIRDRYIPKSIGKNIQSDSINIIKFFSPPQMNTSLYFTLYFHH